MPIECYSMRTFRRFSGNFGVIFTLSKKLFYIHIQAVLVRFTTALGCCKVLLKNPLDAFYQHRPHVATGILDQ